MANDLLTNINSNTYTFAFSLNCSIIDLDLPEIEKSELDITMIRIFFRAYLVTVLKALVQIFDITLQATLYDNLEKKNPGGSFS